MLTRQTARSCSSRHSHRICHSLRYHQSAQSIRASDPGISSYGTGLRRCFLRRSRSKAGGITSRRMASAATLSHDRRISSGVTSSSVNSSPQAASRHMLMCAATRVDNRLTCSWFISGRTSRPSSPSWLAIKRNEAETWLVRTRSRRSRHGLMVSRR